MERPTGITILALFNFIWAFFSVLTAMVFFSGLGLVGVRAGAASAVRGGAPVALARGLGTVSGILVASGIEVLAGVGLLKLRNWARILTIILASVGLLLAARGVVTSLLHFQLFALVIRSVFVGFYALILWYLFQARVRRAFGVT